jgi:hypothetical protein
MSRAPRGDPAIKGDHHAIGGGAGAALSEVTVEDFLDRRSDATVVITRGTTYQTAANLAGA